MGNTSDLNKITGFCNRSHNQKWRQLGTTAATVTQNFYALIPVDGDAVLSVLTAKGGDGSASALGWIDNATKTFYQDKYYPGPFTHIRVSSGVVIIYFDES
jgi:hypothetical protein